MALAHLVPWVGNVCLATTALSMTSTSASSFLPGTAIHPTLVWTHSPASQEMQGLGLTHAWS